MGASEVASTPLPRRYDVNTYKSTHVQGGTIMGSNPGNSVVNTWLQHWQMPNLFVLGAFDLSTERFGQPDFDDSGADAAHGGRNCRSLSEAARTSRLSAVNLREARFAYLSQD